MIKKERKKERAISKSILKISKATLTLPNYKAPSILNDPNRFFKNEMEETKKSLFFE